MSPDPLDPAPPADDPGNVPPHQVMQEAVSRPIEVSPIHVRIQGRCMAALVVNVDAEDPLSAVFTVDAVVFQPPIKRARDQFERANTRPGNVRWVNNAKHATVAENIDLTWHYPGRDCLPEVVLRGTVSPS
jgi:hypothetical protein